MSENMDALKQLVAQTLEQRGVLAKIRVTQQHTYITRIAAHHNSAQSEQLHFLHTIATALATAATL